MADLRRVPRERRSRSHDRGDTRFLRVHNTPPPPQHAVYGAQRAWPTEQYEDGRHNSTQAYGPAPEPVAVKSDMFHLENVIRTNCDHLREVISKTFKELDTGITQTIQAQFETQQTAAAETGKGSFLSGWTSQDNSHQIRKLKELKERELREKELKEKELKEKLRIRESELMSMTNQRDTAVERRVEQESKTDNLQDQLKKAEDAVRKGNIERNSLLEERTRLKNIIQNNNLRDGEPLDDEFIKWFADLRALIENLVRECLEIPQNPYYDGANETFREFYARLRALSSPKRDLTLKINRVRGMIYWILQQTIFSRPLFGIGGKEEEGLVLLEQSLVNSQGSSFSDFIKWRKRTILCIQSLQHPKLVPEEPIHALLEFCLPLRQIAEYNSGDTNLEKRVEDLCSKTYQFALRLRATESLFEVKAMEEGMPLHSIKGKEYSVQASEGASGKGGIQPGSKVLYNIFGYLEKREHPASESLYLERAHVVVTV